MNVNANNAGPFAVLLAIAAALLTLSAAELLVHIASIEQASALGRIGFMALCILLASTFGTREWVLSALAVSLAVGLYSAKGGMEDILFALDRAAFFAAFIYLVTLLKEAAQRSPSVLALGTYITRQPAGRRFYSLATGGHILGVLLNFGAISLLTPLIQRGARAASDDAHQLAIAEQQQISALLRGFAWMIMWSPTALTQAVLFTAFPSVDLRVVITLGISATIIMVLLGRLEDRFRWAGVSQVVYAEKRAFPSAAVARFIAICTVIICGTFLSVKLFSVSAALGLMVIAPIVMVGWIFEQEFVRNAKTAFANTGRTVGTILTTSAPVLGRSAFTLGAAGFIGEAAARLLPVSSFADLLGISAMPDWLFLMVLPILITLGGQIALSPILIVVFLSAIINQLPVLPADPNLIVFSLGAGWAMSMTASPNASATLLISGVTGIAPTTLTWRWNGVYSILCYCVFCIAFFALTAFFPAP